MFINQSPIVYSSFLYLTLQQHWLWTFQKL